MDVHAGKTRIE